MNRRDYCDWIEQYAISEERDKQILQAIQENAKPRRRSVHLRRTLLLAATLFLLTAAAAALSLKFTVFRNALGDNISQWEDTISETVFTEFNTKSYHIRIDHAFFTASSVQFVATFTPSGTSAQQDCAFDFGISLRQQNGQAIDFGENIYIEELPAGKAAERRFACSFLLDTTQIRENTSLTIGCCIYKSVSGEIGALLETGQSAAVVIQAVDSSAIPFFVDDANIEKVVLTPVSVLCYGNEAAVAAQEGIGKTIYDLRIACKNGATLCLRGADLDEPLLRGGIGNVTAEEVTYFLAIKAIVLSDVAGIYLNGHYYPAE